MPRHSLGLAFLLLIVAVQSSPANDDVADLLKQVRAVGPQGTGSAPARAACDRLVSRGPTVLPAILEAMDTPDTVAANWLRSAFDRIVDAAGKDGKGIDTDALLRFAKEPKRQGRARRLALDLVEDLRPGTRIGLLRGWTNDPEFRYDAIDQALADLDRDKDLPAEKRSAVLRDLFASTRDLTQSKTVAAKLKGLGTTVSVADHFGFLRDWYVIGPFDAHGMKGFKSVYPPEEKIDLAASYDGKDKRVGWKRYRSPETPGGAHVALINLREPLGDAEDAVAYAYTAIEVNDPREVEFRGAADDNLSVWVNGNARFRIRGVSQWRAFRSTPLPRAAEGGDEYDPDESLPGAVGAAGPHRAELGVPAAHLRCGWEGVVVQKRVEREVEVGQAPPADGGSGRRSLPYA